MNNFIMYERAFIRKMLVPNAAKVKKNPAEYLDTHASE